MESYQNTEEKVNKHPRHYPKVSCIPFCNITDRFDYTHESLETGYRTGDYIHTLYDEIGNNPKLENLKKQHSKMKDLEGLKLVLDWHGDNFHNITLYGDEIDQLRSTLEMVKDFLKEHKNAKVYIENEACYGAENLQAIDCGVIKEQVNLWDLVMKYLGEDKNHVYCRQVKKDYIHNPDRWTVKNVRNAYHCCGHKGKLDENYLNINNKPQEVKNCGTFQYFPLSDVANRENAKYSGLWGKRKKNKFLNWSKFDRAEPPMSSGDYANKEGYCYSKAINPECWSEDKQKHYAERQNNIQKADQAWKQGHDANGKPIDFDKTNKQFWDQRIKERSQNNNILDTEEANYYYKKKMREKDDCCIAF